jgi:hypothetical protein
LKGRSLRELREAAEEPRRALLPCGQRVAAVQLECLSPAAPWRE